MHTLPKNVTVYLAGPINGRSDADCMDWRREAFRRLECGTFDPMVRDYRGRELEPGIAAEIVELDKKDIDNCDLLLVYFDKPSVGTSMEVFYAWERRKEVVVVNASGKALSPWMIYHSTYQVDSLDQAIDLINSALRLRNR